MKLFKIFIAYILITLIFLLGLVSVFAYFQPGITGMTIIWLILSLVIFFPGLEFWLDEIKKLLKF